MKRLITSLLLLCAVAFGAGAQILTSAHPQADSIAFAKVRARMDSIRQYRPTVGLVLAGGGARGLAHLGVIKYMEELGIPVDLVTGTSMGGLVGGLYALGYKHDQLDSLVRAIEWPVMMSDDIPNDYIGYKLRKYRDKFILRIPHHYDNEDLAERFKHERIADKMAEESGHSSEDMLNESVTRMGLGMPDGFLYGLNVRNMLSSVSVGYQDSLSFADLPIPYACVATDLYAMTPKYWTSGSITDALRSTMAIPFYFRAVRQNGEVLLDGGMRNNFPADIARAMGADIIIGSDMAIHRELNELNSPVDFLMQTITLLSSTANGPAREMLDLNVHHELKGYTMLSFDDASVDDIIDQGYKNALREKDLFDAIAACVAGRQEPAISHPAPAVNLAQRKVAVEAIRFDGIPDSDRSAILHPRDIPEEGTLFDREMVEEMLNKIYGTNAFESVTYHLEGREEPYTLVFDCQKGQTNDAAVGIRADTDETVAIALHYGLGTRRLSGPRLTVDLKLGTNPALSVDWAYKSRIGLPTVGVTARTRLLNSTSGYMSTVSDKLLTTALDAYVEDSRMRMGSMRAGLTAEMDPYEHYLTLGKYWSGWDWRSYWLSAFTTLKFDNFNDGYFPTRGIRLTLDGRYVFKGYSIDMDPKYAMNYEPDEYQALTEDGSIPRYLSVLASFQGAFSLGSHLALLPSLYMGWYSLRQEDVADENTLNPKHIVTVGGFLPNRYTERQIPFFGFPNGYRNCRPFSTVAQLDLRYCFARKNFLTARCGAFFDDYSLTGLFDQYPVMAYGLEYARQTLVGPLKLAVQYCPNLTGLTAYASIGFDF